MTDKHPPGELRWVRCRGARTWEPAKVDGQDDVWVIGFDYPMRAKGLEQIEVGDLIAQPEVVRDRLLLATSLSRAGQR